MDRVQQLIEECLSTDERSRRHIDEHLNYTLIGIRSSMSLNVEELLKRTPPYEESLVEIERIANDEHYTRILFYLQNLLEALKD